MREYRLSPEFRVAGRTLSGRAMRYGDVSPSFRERFVPGALRHSGRIDVNLQHDSSLVVARGAVLTDSPRELRVRAELPPGSAALDLVRRGALSGFSIEFHSRAERREGGVRVVERADLTGLALVDRGAYPGATAEVRARSGRTLRSRVPYDESLACECIARSGPGTGGECIPLARFSKAVGDEWESLFEEIAGDIAEREQAEVLAVAKDYGRPLGSVSRGTLRGRSTDDAFEIEVDLPTGTAGDELVAAHEAAGVITRPLINMERSDYTDTDAGREYRSAYVRAFLVGSTDARGGWPDATIDYDGEGRRAAPAACERRRRIWL